MLTGYTIDVYRDIDESEEEDIYLDEFKDEIDEWVIEALKSIGCATAKSVLAKSREELIEGADLEEDTVDEVIKILKAEEMPQDFHARFNCKSKRYIYRILNSGDTDIFRRNYCWQIDRCLDAEAMSKAAGHIAGTHDFACFQASGGQERETTVRTIYSLDVCRNDEEIEISVTGDGFLYNMVRIITGTLVEVGKGRMAPEYIEEIISSKDRTKAGPTAPPQGLYLAEVYY